MDETAFWQMIDEARTAANGDQDKIVDHLVTALALLPVEEIIDYQVIFDTLDHKADTWDLLGAAIIICSPGDDGWHDFRGWLIAQGKDVYYKALADAESLVDIADTIPYDPEVNFYDATMEFMLYSANFAYQRKMGINDDDYDFQFLDLAAEKRASVDYSVRREDSPCPWDRHDIDGEEKYLPRLAARFPNPNSKKSGTDS